VFALAVICSQVHCGKRRLDFLQTRFAPVYGEGNMPGNTAPTSIPPSAPIKVAVVEDILDIRESLRIMINGTPGFRCAGAYYSAEEAIEKISKEAPDVVLMDIGLPKMSGIEAREGQDGELISNSRIYVAPGDYHMTIEQGPEGPRISLDRKAQENFVRPAVDPLFRTAAHIYGRNLLGIVLTGMGSDGRQGACAVKQCGGTVLIQSESSCVVYGMPKEAVKLEAVDEILPLLQIPKAIFSSLYKSRI